MRKFLASVLFSLTTVLAVAQAPPGAGPGKHQAKLTCVPSTSTVVGYKFYRGSATGGPYSQLDSSVPTCAFTDATVTGGQTYFYGATAIDSAGGESAFSNEAKAVIPLSPAAPSGAKAIPGTSTTVISWNAVTAAAFYNVYKDTGSGPVLIGTTTAPTVSFTESAVTAGAQYFVTSLTSGGSESVLSAPATKPPAPPTNLTLTVN
jgi:fibronectin type 3 domain-containing protein